MKSERLFLKPNVMAEPLINQWYAWPYLISPATAAMYLANSHLKIMRSFIAAPQVQAALRDPAMRGGPFISCGADRVDDIRALLARTEKEQADMLELARAIQTLDELLATEATGYSLEPLHQKTPDVLRGYVELVYDLNNAPSMRIIEGLLYKSKYYKPASQSVALSLIHEDGRPFAFSSPALEGGGKLHLQVPFSSPAWDDLFKMREAAQPFAQMSEALAVDEADEPLFSTFFTDEAPPKSAAYDGDGARVRYFGHACLLIEASGLSLLCDPVISYRYETTAPRFTYADLPPRLDYVLITHNHQDHCMLEMLLQLRQRGSFTGKKFSCDLICAR